MEEDNQVSQPAPVVSAVPAQTPAELRKWSWGAFVFNLTWGIGHRVWLSLLVLVPGVNIIMMIILGVYGRRWAWETGRYKSVEELQAIEEPWDFAGMIMFWIGLALAVITIILLIMAMTHTSSSGPDYPIY